MAKLSDDQLAFFAAHGLRESDAFDASGMRRAAYQAQMRALKKSVAYGVSPCAKAGHTLRALSGNCVQCNPLNLVFHQRFASAAWLYIAHSKEGAMVKIGVTKNVNTRNKSLRSQAYGGLQDWDIKGAIRVPVAGEIENEIQNALAQYRHIAQYLKDGHWQTTYELFNCSLSDALITANAILKQRKFKPMVLGNLCISPNPSLRA
jgi:hypothetical protein